MNPIIILGAPRSGTSFLSRIFASHPEVETLVEPRLVWKYGNDAKSDMLKPEAARQEVSDYIHSYFADVLNRSGKVYLVEKTPSNALRVDFVRKVFPDAKFVHILRNGKNSALSIQAYWQQASTGFRDIDPNRLKNRLKEIRLRQVPYYATEFTRRFLGGISPKSDKQKGLWGPRLPGMSEMVRDLNLLEVACLQWRFCVEQACFSGRLLSDTQYMEVRLEDFDESLMHQILDFSGLPRSQEVDLKIKEHFKPGKSTRRTQNVNPANDQIMEKWLRPTLDWLGYVN